MEISQILEKIGLNQKEASIYLALLELGTSSVQGIAVKASVKRPTAYVILKQLQEKGLVSLIPRAGKVLYTAESPEKIISHLNRQQELLKHHLPNMLALFNTKKEKPQILLFEGKQSVRELYDKFLQASEINIFCTISDVMSAYPELPKLLEKRALEKKSKVRELLSQSSKDIEFAKTIHHDEYYQHKFMPKGQEFLTDNILFDNNLAFISYEPYIFAVLIQSKNIYQSVNSLFELAWQTATPYDKIVK